MLAAIIMLYIFAAFLLIFFTCLLIAVIRDGGPDDQETAGLCTTSILGICFVVLATALCIDGNKEYTKITRIYSLSNSSEFVLGVGGGKYYYNLSDDTKFVNIGIVDNDCNTVLIQDDDIEYPYLLSKKVKWESPEYYLYVPENLKIIQYSSK